ncbi:DNA-binding CsgD family transcriptional regulator [Hoeflea marina]|uniref:DNA-binding CsgD family transcriptional regulator n=1 Tax=Hoeflea marina TaxID=274592 RepID=A0A317PLK9_9HYPH|nr:autoinducer binding domain-containing protein [Hoeflea marina]PWW01637.1 DNA-binding CsgD family transcriptional regulator [Hoeflea marina]
MPTSAYKISNVLPSGMPCNRDIVSIRAHIASATSQFDLFRYLREVTTWYGFKYFAVNSIPSVPTTSIAETMIITSAPSDLIRRYDAYSMVASDPASVQMRKACAPFERRIGDIADAQDDANRAVLLALVDEYKLDCWFFIPVFTPDGGAATVSFMGKRNSLSFQEIAELDLLSSLVYEGLCQLSGDTVAATNALSAREHECLSWSAIGKTSFEIGKIIGLSEHTINHYLNSATKKTGSVNRTQAVAVAIRNGWID